MYRDRYLEPQIMLYLFSCFVLVMLYILLIYEYLRPHVHGLLCLSKYGPAMLTIITIPCSFLPILIIYYYSKYSRELITTKAFISIKM